MREITIGKNDAGQRLDRFVSKSLPLLPPALLQKYIRLKRIKCNGARAQRDQRLQLLSQSLRYLHLQHSQSFHQLLHCIS